MSVWAGYRAGTALSATRVAGGAAIRYPAHPLVSWGKGERRMSRAQVKEATVRELVHWWREQGWTPERAHELTRYWPDGMFGPSEVQCAYPGCQNVFTPQQSHPHKRFCSDRCRILQNRHIIEGRAA